MKVNIINTPVKDFSSVNIDDRKKIDIKAGDTVKVWVKITEKNSKGKERIRLQAFEGMVLSQKHGNEPGATITVRKVTKGVGVERIFPIFSPIIDKIEITKRGNVRKSKLYYIREKVNKEIRRQLRKSKLVDLSTISEVETKKKAEQKKKEREKEEKEIKKNENIETNNLEKVNIEDEKKDDKKTETEEKIK